MPRGAIPPATTLFFELHEHDNEHTIERYDTELFIEAYIWYPCYPVIKHSDGTASLGNIQHDCLAHHVPINDCFDYVDVEHDKQHNKSRAYNRCTYDAFKRMIGSRINKTGTYLDLCEHTEQAHKAHKGNQGCVYSLYSILLTTTYCHSYYTSVAYYQ